MEAGCDEDIDCLEQLERAWYSNKGKGKIMERKQKGKSNRN